MGKDIDEGGKNRVENKEADRGAKSVESGVLDGPTKSFIVSINLTTN